VGPRPPLGPTHPSIQWVPAAVKRFKADEGIVTAVKRWLKEQDMETNSSYVK